MEKGLGVVVDCIIRWGKLEPGDYVLSGVHGGKVRILNDGKTSSYFHIDYEYNFIMFDANIYHL